MLINKLVAFLRLIRVYMVIIVGAAVFVGLHMTGCQMSIEKIFYTVFVECLIVAGGFTFNDLCDLERDKIDKPNSPLASGSISKSFAIVFGTIAFISSTILCVHFVGIIPNALISFQILTLGVYSFIKKANGVAGNLVTALLCSSSFLFAASAAQAINFKIAVAIILTFFIIFAREIIKDEHDIMGDRSAKLKTIPIVHGTKKAKKIVLFLTIIIALITIVADFFIINRWFFAFSSVMVVMLFIAYDHLELILVFAKTNINRDLSKPAPKFEIPELEKWRIDEYNLNKYLTISALSFIFGLIAFWFSV